jgi:hypothetical protein
MLAASSLVLLSTLGLVAGHGYVQEILLGSDDYTGYLPYQDPYAGVSYLCLRIN